MSHTFNAYRMSHCDGSESSIDDHNCISEPFENIVLDLGDILFTSTVSSQDLRQILRSSIWYEYEKGNLSQEECYTLASAQFGLSSQDILVAVQAAHESLRSNGSMFNLLREIKFHGKYNLYAMSNISSPDYNILQTKANASEWDLFEGVFTSAAAGERKPNLGFYHYIISQTGINPRRTIFVDAKVENVLTARSMGMYGIISDDFSKISRHLLNLCGNSVARAQEYLHANEKHLTSLTSQNEPVHENFSQLLILEATGDRRLVDFSYTSGFFNFFKGEGQFTTTAFPNDVDTTAIGLTVLADTEPNLKHEVMDKIVGLCNSDGIIQVYFDHSRPRIDPVVCVNALTLFYANDRGEELGPTLNWCYDVLLHRAYMDGTPYYTVPEAFLFFLSRLFAVSVDVRDKFQQKFIERMMERIGVEGDALVLAMRILAAASIGIKDIVDYRNLRTMQESDGSWPAGWLYKYGSSGVLIGNKGLTTALALNAIQLF